MVIEFVFLPIFFRSQLNIRVFGDDLAGGFSFTDHQQLTFEKPDLSLFRNLELAFHALEKGGNMPCIMNAANEIVVDAFLREKAGFLQIPGLIEKTMNSVTFLPRPSLEDYQQSDHEAREFTKRLLQV